MNTLRCMFRRLRRSWREILNFPFRIFFSSPLLLISRQRNEERQNFLFSSQHFLRRSKTYDDGEEGKKRMEIYDVEDATRSQKYFVDLFWIVSGIFRLYGDFERDFEFEKLTNFILNFLFFIRYFCLKSSNSIHSEVNSHLHSTHTKWTNSNRNKRK